MRIIPRSIQTVALVKNNPSIHSLLFKDKETMKHLSHRATWQSHTISQPCHSISYNGKERDAETGYSCFGTRYYDSDLSGLFMSVDPMSYMYSNISPYVYCTWNPVKLVDPDGREVGDYYTTNGTWLGSDGKKDDLAYTATSVQKNSQGTSVS